MPRRFDDDDDRDDTEDRPRPRRSNSGGGMSTTTVVFIVLGIFAAMMLAVCGGLFFIAKRAADQVQVNLQQMQAEMKAEAEAARAEDPDRLPPASDGSSVPNPLTQPPATDFDAPGDNKRWIVLFRGTDPMHWNTTISMDGEFAIPLRAAPKGMKYLRIRRLDTGAAIFISLQRKDLSEQVTVPGGTWNGTSATDLFGEPNPARVGLAYGPVVDVVIAEVNGNKLGGTGLGTENDEAIVCWASKTLRNTKLEFSVTATELTETEKKQLLRDK